MCYQAEKMLAEFGDKITAELRSRIETAFRDAREAVARKDAALAEQRADALGKLLKEAGTVIYAQKPGAGVYAETPAPGVHADAGGQSGEARPSGSGPRGKVVDAEYKETP